MQLAHIVDVVCACSFVYSQESCMWFVVLTHSFCWRYLPFCGSGAFLVMIVAF